jgi:protease I
MARTVLVPVPSRDFDPTEVSIPWRVLTDAGVNVVFTSPGGKPASADPVMVTGRGLGPLKFSMAAGKEAVETYRSLEATGALAKPLRYTDLQEKNFDGLLLPGGHAQGMKEYLESQPLQQFVGSFFATGKPVAAICHGVVLAARSKAPGSLRSILYDKKTTALPAWMELLAWNLTRAWMGDYYRTYPATVQNEVESALLDRSNFQRGPLSLNKHQGFIVRDGNYVSGRWPGDAPALAGELLKMLS